MKVLLIGAFGRMGKEVARVCKEKGYTITGEIDKDYSEDEFLPADVVIDFSTSDDRSFYIDFALKNQIPYCCFSTLVNQNDLTNLKKLSKYCPVLLCSNASKGMNAIFEMIENCAKSLKSADVVVSEYHHRAKKDVPSGTARILVDKLKKCFDGIQVFSYRVGNERGIHKIEFFLEDEVVEISHRVSSRKVFALGAVEMAKKLIVMEKGFYTEI